MTDSDDVTDLTPEPEARGLSTMADTRIIRDAREVARILTAPADLSTLDVKPDGAVYFSHIHARRRLNEAFGPAPHGWKFLRATLPDGSSMPWSKTVRPGKDNSEIVTVAAEFNLWVREANGAWDLRSQAMGEGEYHSNNSNAGFTDATEVAKSQALTRACKDLGIGSECWDKRFTEAFRREHCVKVWVKPERGYAKWMWRRKDADPFIGEEGAANESREQARPASSPRPPADEAPLDPNVSGEGWGETNSPEFVAGEIESVRKTTSKTTGKDLFWVKVAGEDFSFHDRNFEAALSKAKAEGRKIALFFKTNGNFKNAKGFYATS